MIHPTVTDIVELLKQIVRMLQPFAQTQNIILRHEPGETKIELLFRPDLVIHDMTTLIFNLISYIPPQNTLTIIADWNSVELKITIVNTGINLAPVTEITRSCRHNVIVKGDEENKQTNFSFLLPLTNEKGKEENDKVASPVNFNNIPEYYNEIRSRLRSHFSKADTLVAQLSILYPKEAAFLQKINAVIITNLDNERFDTSVLSREMNMSRTALFRRLKPLIQQPPAAYIKSIRLHKAKELLETTDISVGEAAFKSGFQTPSHFTKAFTDAFGFLPSAIRRKNHSATKE